jgi:hypothetical protein
MQGQNINTNIPNNVFAKGVNEVFLNYTQLLNKYKVEAQEINNID